MSRRTRASALACLAALGIVAAACGSSKKAAETTTTTASSTNSSSASSSSPGTTGAPATAAPLPNALAYDESAKCNTADYKGELAKIQAVDAQTVKFTLCNADVAFPSKVALANFQIYPAAYIDKAGPSGDIVNNPVGTGPYKLKAWDRGNQIVLERNDDYWGDKAKAKTAVFKWNTEAAQRLVELQSGAADGIDNVGPADFDRVKSDSSLKLVERPALNVMYLGMNRDMKPFDDERVRQAIGLAIDKQRIVDNFYPKGSEAATQFLPPGIPGYAKDFKDFTPDQAKAKQLLADAGYPNGFPITLSYRNVVRGYLPQPDKVAQDIQDQLGKIGIKVTLDQQESTTFLDNAQGGKLPFYMLGWGADYPDATNFLDYHFGKTSSPQFGKGFEDIWANLDKAASLSDQDQRNTIYADVAKQLAQHAPMVPIAYGGSATAYKSGVTNPQASPLSNEQLSLMQVPNQDQFTFEQNAEPGGLYCADETDGESLRVCEQIGESLLGFKPNSTDVVPALATDYKASPDLKEWTFTLRPNVKFSDGTVMNANDVARSFRVQWDAKDPAHKGRTGDFEYFASLFGGFVNPPPPKS